MMEKKNQTENKKVKLAKVLAHAGIASRRASEALILNGDISVNGKIETNVARTVDPATDKIRYKGELFQSEHLIYYKVYKPAGYTSSSQDPHADKLVVDLVPKKPRVYPVGRLDKDSEGLMILTNDGDFTQRMTHPKFEVTKVYDVSLAQDVQSDLLVKLKKGIRLQEGVARADAIKKLGSNRFRISIHQGWNRQIRRMCEVLGYTVTKLVRIEEGAVKLGTLQPGEYKKMSKPE